MFVSYYVFMILFPWLRPEVHFFDVMSRLLYTPADKMTAIMVVFNELEHIPAVHLMSDRTVISLLLCGNRYERSGFLIIDVSVFKVYIVIIFLLFTQS